MKRSNEFRWKRISVTTVRYNRFWKFLKIDARLPTGQRGIFYVRKAQRIICALVLTPEHRVVLIEQYRVGPNQVIAELPGGSVEPKESPRAAAQREVLEETGYSGTPHLVASSFHEAWSTAVRYHFVVTNARKVGEPHFDRFEFGRVVTKSLQEFRRYIQAGNSTDIETAYLALDYLKLL